ncbi:MAG: DUF3846 domain-containing protein [Bacillota bacterium]
MEKIIFVDHHQNRIIELPKTLQERQKLVGADYLDVLRLPNNIDIWFDDEGAFKEHEFSSVIVTPNGDVHQIPGTYFVASVNDKTETIGLTQEQIIYFCNRIGYKAWKNQK